MKSYAVIGYPRGKMELSCPLGTTRHLPQAKFPRKPYTKSFIDQAYSVKMAGYWPRSFFFASQFMDLRLDSVSFHKHAKKRGQYPAMLTSHIFSFAHAWSKRVTWLNVPAKTREYPRVTPLFSNLHMLREIDLKDHKHESPFGGKILGYLFLPLIRSSKLTTTL